MKMFKIITIGLLFIVLITSISLTLESVDAVLKGKGRGVTEIRSDGTWSSYCNNYTDDDCTIVIHMPNN